MADFGGKENSDSENSDSTAIVPYTPRSSNLARKRRLEEIMNIIDDFDRQGIVHNNGMIREELWKRGYYIRKSAFYEDMKEIDRLNTYVVDIAKAHYARMIEYCFENLEKVVRRCDEIYSMQWSNSKRVRKAITAGAGGGGEGGNKTIEEMHEGVELAGPKLKALDINIKAIKVMLDALNGSGVISVAANLLHAQFMEINEIKNKLEEELKVKSAELDELKREKA